jgi:AraC-like DNA-binding protein
MDQDSRGILDPARMRRVVTLNRYPAGPALAGLVEWFWAVAGSLPPGQVHVQRTLTHPGVNISVATGQADEQGRPGPVGAELTGVQRELTERRLGGTGWGVAALTACGGLGAFVTGPVSELTDRVTRIGEYMKLDDEDLVRDVVAAGDERARIDLLRSRLEQVVAAADPARVETARQVTAVAALAARDRSLRRLEDLAEASGVGARTLQRLFAEYAGVSPTWVLRRYRLLEAAEYVRDGRTVRWAEVAAELGYSDQAHLVRDFRAAIGTTPAAYAQTQLPF